MQKKAQDPGGCAALKAACLPISPAAIAWKIIVMNLPELM